MEDGGTTAHHLRQKPHFPGRRRPGGRRRQLASLVAAETAVRGWKPPIPTRSWSLAAGCKLGTNWGECVLAPSPALHGAALRRRSAMRHHGINRSPARIADADQDTPPNQNRQG